ncbi:bifunctional enoyl-CoA hydratase/phosphate acetyltransferase [Desulfuromonas sp. TF]|jgi:phosphate butyryltransferase|uniref:bifunctional enoyl-CoA hydratase/phosphate acetyltransferase n=1 Tax=Desulfuromonas sp. TF TaxID=1232410 RepID=UPI00040D761C|nr:bifunctional enoyl-CoA hydratase/phosphate acetyltransferase [Desulfuromonas sp. TF]
MKCLDDLLVAVQDRPVKKIALAVPEEPGLIKLVKQATELRLAEFILVGDEDRIKELLSEQDLDFKDFEIQDRKDHKQAAERAVSLVVEKMAEVVMKGELHTATFLKAVLGKEKGLRTGNLISEITLYDKIDGGGLQLITDCAMNISPTLDEKKQILENAVELARKLGYEKPKVAVLSALEVVNPAIPDTLDAAILSKMADRGQIKNAVVDGPFALDNALSIAAAKQKKIGGEVAGKADIILVPNLQVGNALHKALVYIAEKKIAAAIMGAAAPIVMLSRSDSTETKLVSVALATYIS